MKQAKITKVQRKRKKKKKRASRLGKGVNCGRCGTGFGTECRNLRQQRAEERGPRPRSFRMVRVAYLVGNEEACRREKKGFFEEKSLVVCQSGSMSVRYPPLL